MATSLVRAGQARRTETPNALMTTLASPSQGPTAGLSMWRVEMRAGQQGPPHAFDTEQVWHLLALLEEDARRARNVMLLKQVRETGGGYVAAGETAGELDAIRAGRDQRNAGDT